MPLPLLRRWCQGFIARPPESAADLEAGSAAAVPDGTGTRTSTGRAKLIPSGSQRIAGPSGFRLEGNAATASERLSLVG
jgi:hypothetical protein